MDIESIIKKGFEGAQKPAQNKNTSRYIVLKVSHVAVGAKDRMRFRVTGERVDNGEKIQVFGKKSNSNQALPEVGRAMRADRVTPIDSKNGITAYDAAYFKALDTCLDVVALPTPSYKNKKGMIEAGVRAVDPAGAIELGADTLLGDSIDQHLAKMLRPWERDTKSSLTHDVLGDPLWGDGKAPIMNASPFLVLKFAGEELLIYGPSAVRSEQYTDDNRDYRLPTMDETLESIKNNEKLSSLKAVCASLSVSDLKPHPIDVVEGLYLRVGFGSMGTGQNHIKVPNHTSKTVPSGDAGGSKVVHGYNNVLVNVKKVSDKSMFVTEVVPSPNAFGSNGFSQSVPLTPNEIARQQKMEVASQQQNQQKKPQEQPEPEQYEDHFEQLDQDDRFAPIDDASFSDANEYASYGEDLSDIGDLSDSYFDDSQPAEPADDMLDAQLSAARARAAKSSGPRM